MADKKANSRRTLKQRVRDASEAHRKRHTPSGLKFVLADSIDLVPAGAWDALTTSSSYFLSREYLKVVEQAGPENVSGRYAMAFDGRMPVAAIAAQLVEIDGRKLMKQDAVGNDNRSVKERIRGLVNQANNTVKQKALSRIKGRLLVCGNLQSWGQHAVALAPDYSPDIHWTAVAEALYRIRRADRLSGQTDIVMVKDFAAGEEAGITTLESFEYRPLETDPNMVLDIPETWHTFDDYINSLASKYRSGARKIVKDVTNAGIELELLTDVSACAERLHQLYLNVHAKAAIRPVTLSVAYLPTLAAACGSRFRCTVAKRGSEILGFITSLKDGDTSVGYYIGFDYEANQQCPLYFRLLQVCIDDAVRFGCRRVSFGRTALDPKARMGARPVPMKIWLRHRQPILNWMIRGLLGAIPHDEAPERNPFKGG